MWKSAFAALTFIAQAALANAGAVELNQGTVADLDGLPGVGPAMSRRILAARQQADFRDWPDFLARVKGVKQKTAQKLSDAGLTVNGRPYDAGPVRTPEASAQQAIRP